MNGWQRIWLTITVILGILIGLLASDGVPKRHRIVSDWYSDASDLIARKVSDAEGQYVNAGDVQDRYFSGTEAENIDRLKSFELNPTEKAKIFSSDIARINKEHEAELHSLSGAVAKYWLFVALWWVAASAFVYLIGWTLGWIWRGFFPGRQQT